MDNYYSEQYIDYKNTLETIQKGLTIKQIARELNMSKNTVRNLIKKDDESKYSRSVNPTSIDDYKDKI